MTLAAGRQLDRRVGTEIGEADRASRIAGRLVVDANAALLDQAPRFGVGFRQPGFDDKPEQRKPCGEFATRLVERGQVCARRALLEDAPRGVGGARRRSVAMQQARRLEGQDLFRLVDLRALQRGQPCDLVERQIGEQPQEAADVAIVGVAPELPVVVGRKQVTVEPDCSCVPLSCQPLQHDRCMHLWQQASVEARGQNSPPSDLPIFLPSDVLMRGAVRANTCFCSTRLHSSTPLTCFPHLSLCTRKAQAHEGCAYWHSRIAYWHKHCAAAADAQREVHGRQGDDSGQECAWRGRWGTSVQVRVHTPCCPTGRSRRAAGCI